MRKTPALAAAVAVAVVALAAVLHARDESEQPRLASLRPAAVVDERAGSVRGVRFGDTGPEVLDRLGPPADEEPGFFPAGREYTGPPSIPTPASDRGSRIAPATLHYDDAAFLVSETAGVFAMAALREGARTRAGVAVGDPLERVGDAYAGVACGEAVAGESLLPRHEPTYRWCRARVGRVRAFFGGDPIESITLSVTGER